MGLVRSLCKFLLAHHIHVLVPSPKALLGFCVLLNLATPAPSMAQDNLLCAAKHMFWAGTYGRKYGGDSGENDAFNTLMAILRAKHRHPGVPADRLREADSQLKLFMECRLPKERGSSGEPLCLHTTDPARAAHEEPCIPAGAPQLQVAGFKIRRMPPGGAVCHGAPNIAQCRRFSWGSM